MCVEWFPRVLPTGINGGVVPHAHLKVASQRFDKFAGMEKCPVTRVPDWVVLLLLLMGVPGQSLPNGADTALGDTGNLQEQHHMGHPETPEIF